MHPETVAPADQLAFDRIAQAHRPLLLGRRRSSHPLDRFLAERGLGDAIVGTLRGEERALGFLIVGNRAGDIGTFTETERELFERFAGHASVLLENSRLEQSLAQVTELQEELRHQAYHDALTGLPNRVLFTDQVTETLARETGNETTHAVLFVDLDHFKNINDSWGHAAGDELLVQVADRLRGQIRPGDVAARLGGDEFALLLPGLDAHEAVSVARSIVERVGAAQLEQVGELTVSAGVATFPVQGVGRDELIRLADSALYWAKEDGKNRARAYEPAYVELKQLQQLAESTDRAARYRAAASLAKAVDARDAYTGSHSERVGELAARISRRLGLDDAQVELTRLAASLHDLGKLAIPEEILRKPSALNESECLVLQRHPQIGFRMLESLGVEPIADWVLHHHERWDGAGYPDRLRGEEIPLGARIIFVADAYDAMTSERVYRRPLGPEEALEELERCSGSQFDPAIVEAFRAELAFREPLPAIELVS
jgi:diguanylate cyclase (GGDEF)-like protein